MSEVSAANPSLVAGVDGSHGVMISSFPRGVPITYKILPMNVKFSIGGETFITVTFPTAEATALKNKKTGILRNTNFPAPTPTFIEGPTFAEVAKIHFTSSSSTVASLRYGTTDLQPLAPDIDGLNGKILVQQPPIAGEGVSTKAILVSTTQSQSPAGLHLPGGFDIGSNAFETLLHETAHTLGLKHPDDSDDGSVLLPANQQNWQFTIVADHIDSDIDAAPTGLQIYDIAALQSIYGANNSVRTGNDTYKFPTTPFYYTIWDTGGTDTIDAGNQTTPATIDLREGHFSSIGAATGSLLANRGHLNNVAIAFNVTIENAKGGSDHNTFIANHADNVITGGDRGDAFFENGAVYDRLNNNGTGTDSSEAGGNDTFIGGKGNDTFYLGMFGTADGTQTAIGGVGKDVGNDVANFLDSKPVNVLIENGIRIDESGFPIVLHEIPKIVGSGGKDLFKVELGQKKRVSIQDGGQAIVVIDKGDLIIDLGDPEITSKTQAVVEVSGAAKVFDNNDPTTIDGSESSSEIFLGKGNDTLVNAGAGSIIHAGTGHDVFNFTNGVLVSGAKTTDTFLLYGKWELTGASGWIGQQDPWTTNPLDGVSYGINQKGQLEIKVGESVMFVDGYGAQQSLVPQNNVGDILLNDRSFSSSLLLKLKNGINWLQSQFAFVNAESKADLGQAIYNGVDPLVFDLTGAGINLTAPDGTSPMLDMNANGFKVHSGWIEANEGVLVLDKNGSGQVENVTEMLGGPGQSAFAELAKYDANLDGVIDAKDSIYSQLRIWVDSNDDGVVDPGELLTLQQAGIASINLGVTAQAHDFIAGNQVLATGSFTRTDGSTGAVDALSFATDNFDSQFRGSIAVSAAAAALPNVKGYGTLTDLQVAMTNDPALNNPALGPSLMSVVEATMPTLTAIDLASLRNEVMPILMAWAKAVQGIDDNGNPIPIPATQHPDVAILVSDNSGGAANGVDTSQTITVDDFTYEVTDGLGSYWKLASGASVVDANGNAIARPTLAQVLADVPSGEHWTNLPGAQLDFLERYLGNPIPLGTVAPQNPGAALSNLSASVNVFMETLDQLTVRLAMQGPLAPYFAGVTYSAATDKFTPTTDQQLTPMYEAIFRAAPQNVVGAAGWLAEWRPIVDIMLGDFQESAGSGIQLTYGYEFASMVRAFETVGLPLDIISAAEALGVPAGKIFMGGATVTGNNSGDIFYLGNGDQTVIGSTGGDNFVLGGHFGHDVIDDDQPFALVTRMRHQGPTTAVAGDAVLHRLNFAAGASFLLACDRAHGTLIQAGEFP